MLIKVSMKFYEIAIKYLRTCGIEVSGLFIREKMESHPDYPSLVSLTDTLDELDLPYWVNMSSLKEHQNFTYPLLAHVNSSVESNFVIVEDAGGLNEIEKSGTLQWSGITIIVPPEKVITSPEHNKLLLAENSRKIKLILSCACILCVLFIPVLSSIWPLVVLSFLCISGMVITWIIGLYSMGKKTNLSDFFCSSGSEVGCNKVMKSDGSKLFGISLSDFGFVYFFSFAIFLSLSTSLRFGISYIWSINSIIILVGVPFVIFSLFYQWYVIKEWCRMCLSVVVLIIAMLVILILNWPELQFVISVNSIEVLVISTLLAGVILFLFRDNFVSNNDYILEKINSLKFKRNPDIIVGHLKQQRKIDTSLFEGEMVFGSPAAKLQILTVCQLYCKPCARAHKIIDKLREKYQDDICVVVRFFESGRLNDNHINPVGLIFNAVESMGQRIDPINEWFELMNLEKFQNTYSSTIPNRQNFESYSGKVRAWLDLVEIKHTPSIFLNGYEFSTPYDFGILPSVITTLLESSTFIEETVVEFK